MSRLLRYPRFPSRPGWDRSGPEFARGPAAGADGLVSPGAVGVVVVVVAVVFVPLAAQAAPELLCACQALSAPTRALGERRGEMNHPPPQLANSKQIKLSLVPARLLQGALWGDWCLPELLKERVE